MHARTHVCTLARTHARMHARTAGKYTRRDTRCEYAFIGDVVNTSARLMSEAASGTVLCDNATYERSNSQITFDPQRQ